MAVSTSSQSFTGMALPASVLEAKGMGERGESGGSFFVTPNTEEGVERGQPQTAIVATSGAREGPCSDGKREGRELGLVEEGMGVLTMASNRAGNGWTKGVDIEQELRRNSNGDR